MLLKLLQEKWLVAQLLNPDVYQISHHEACTEANQCQWLEAIQPQEAFISHVCNIKEKYGHPCCDAIETLTHFGEIATKRVDCVLPLIHSHVSGKSRGIK